MARIMIVDDASFVRLTLREMLEKAGHMVVCEADNGRDAIEVYKNYRPDVVLMDITMPEMNGILGAKGISEFDPNAKIIMVSAMGQQAMVVEAMQAGARDFVVKPFKPERVLEAVEVAMRRS